MKHARLIWIGFAFCLAVVLAAMGWISLAAVRLQRAEVATRRQAELEETVRLSLWRIDAILAPLVTQESVRPWFCYRSFLPLQRLYNQAPGNGAGAGLSLPSPLLTATMPGVLVYFQIEPDGRLSSPQAPSAAERRWPLPPGVTAATIAQARRRLAEVAALVDRKKLAALLPPRRPEAAVAAVSPLEPQPPAQRMAQQLRRATMQRDAGQSAVEYDERRNMMQNSASVAVQSNPQAIPLPAGPLPPTELSGTPMTPLWIGGSLLLARRVTMAGREYFQGCLLDWPALKKSLLEEIADLQPAADLAPAVGGSRPEEAHLAAALPIRLIPGPLPGDSRGPLSPILLSLGIAWACVLLAAAAVGGLLAGVMRLSGRRAQFVSAVTHELRTPLTTFRMYAEMLADGMVPEEARQKEYLQTLRAEADRLIHLVENVLAYARLERGRGDGPGELSPLGQLVEPLQPRLASHAARMGMELVVECDEASAPQTTVRANASAVEQILFNLVDNACKYAAAAADKRIHLRLGRRGDGAAELRVQDHGPGVRKPPRRLFRSFSKSAGEAAQSAPGIGLGLALSRRLARSLHGDLRLESGNAEGACFLLTLPAAGP
jgi:signal transduction histidine kinase